MKFKKLLAVLLSVILAFSLCIAVSAEEITGGVNGDVNKDGFTNSLDLTTITKTLLNVEVVEDFDVNYDKANDIRDLVALKNFVLGVSEYADNEFNVADM